MVRNRLRILIRKMADRKRILIVTDPIQCGQVYAREFESLGYDSLAVKDAPSARGVIRGAKGGIDGVFVLGALVKDDRRLADSQIEEFSEAGVDPKYRGIFSISDAAAKKGLKVLIAETVTPKPVRAALETRENVHLLPSEEYDSLLDRCREVFG